MILTLQISRRGGKNSLGGGGQRPPLPPLNAPLVRNERDERDLRRMYGMGRSYGTG